MLYFLLFSILLIIILYIVRVEGFQPVFPNQIQQPQGPRGWGYRDPVATLNTILWQQSRPYVLMPKFNVRTIPSLISLSTPSAPVPVKKACGIRPPKVDVEQRNVASAPYTSF